MENVIFINFDRNFMPQPGGRGSTKGKRGGKSETSSAQGCASWKFHEFVCVERSGQCGNIYFGFLKIFIGNNLGNIFGRFHFFNM